MFVFIVRCFSSNLSLFLPFSSTSFDHSIALILSELTATNSSRERGSLASRSTTRADRGYISRLGKRDGRLGDSNGEREERDYIGLEEKVPWIRLRKRAETGGDAVPWVRLKKAGTVPSVIVDSGEEVEKVWYV